MQARNPKFGSQEKLSLFIVSAAVIILQIVLMRSLAVRFYSHFSYVIIGTALLGFGASGTFLYLSSRVLQKEIRISSIALPALFFLSISVSYGITLKIPVDIQYIFFSRKQLLHLIVLKALLFIPFFFGALYIGLNLLYFRKQASRVYAVNLVGSGIGGIIATSLMYKISPEVLPFWIPILGVPSLFIQIARRSTNLSAHSKRLLFLLTASAFLLPIFLLRVIPSNSQDPYKMIAYLERLESQSDAKKMISIPGPRGKIEVFDSPMIHQTLFAGVGATANPPPQLTLLVDGHLKSPVFKINSGNDLEILDHTPQSIGYRLVKPRSVLLLGESGGVNVWLAKRYSDCKITVVQANPQINHLLKGELATISGNVFNQANVNVITESPHLFIRQTKEKFDLVHLAVGEGMAAGASSLMSSHEDYLLTLESIMQSFRILTDSGIITLTRGIQYPPRDNIRVFALFAQALKSIGITQVHLHLVQVRNYLAVNTILAKTPIFPNTVKRLAELCHTSVIDIEYHPGINSDHTNQYNQLAGPAGTSYSYLHHAIQQILFGDRNEFFDDWIYQIRPNTENNPYFYNFFKWKSLRKFFETYKTQLFQKLEVSYLVLALSLGELLVAGLLLILFPLLILGSSQISVKTKGYSSVYFFCIGLSFILVEMSHIQKFTQFLGDPIYSISLVLTTLLIAAGLGSEVQSRIPLIPSRKICLAVVGIILISITNFLLLGIVMSDIIQLKLGFRLVIAGMMLMPLGFMMGWLFPIGITTLEKNGRGVLPWAWGINGFASVLAAPLAVMLSMSFGFTTVLFIALILYTIAGLAFQQFEGTQLRS